MSFLFSLPRFYFGTRLADHIEGGPDDDFIFGLDGHDRVDAGAGDDRIVAGAGNDEIDGGEGSDLILGGGGFDTAIYSGRVFEYRLPRLTGLSNTIFTVTDANGDRDILNHVEAIRFEASDYTLYLDGRNNAVLAASDGDSTDEDSALAINVADLTSNDRDFDGDRTEVVAVSQTSAAGASVSLAEGVVSYDSGTIFQYLNEGETAVDSFIYTVDDGKGGTDTATVAVTITGANDAAVITGDTSGLVVEASGAGSDTSTATGVLMAEDVDNSDGFRSARDQASAMGYGIYSIDENGNWIYTLDNENATVDALDSGESLTDRFTVLSTDGTAQEVTITINGADDTAPAAPRINEIHYDNVGTDTGEFIEVRVAAGADVSGLLVELYNGNGGSTYGSTAVSGLPMTSDGEYNYYLWNLPANGIQNGAPDGLALSENGTLIEFLSYEGSFTAANGAAAGTTSTDMGVAEAGNDTAGLSLQRIGDGPTGWVGPQEQTPGSANESDGGGGEPTSYLISEIQGSGTASLLTGEYVLVSAVVTYTVADGFYLQEEDHDADGNSATSEGIFVFTGGAPSVTVGDKVEVAGTVTEYFDFTEITDVTDIISISSGNVQPTSAAITLSPDFAANLEHYEGMAIILMSGTDDPLTVIENFDLDRYGEITVSAGSQIQPTQIYDPTTQQSEIQALQAANANNRLTIDDGFSAQNPDEFRYIPASAGDNGNGYLDAGDTFTENGPTLRLGAELTGSVEGVLSYGFGAYKMLVDGVLPVDQATNGAARSDAPEDVGGRLTVSSFNLLNFFTTLDDGSGAGSGPNNLEPRGATTAEDLARQTDKIVEAMLQIDASVFGLQELENNGFDSASAIATLVDALNAAAGPGVTYAFIDPTDPGSDGFIGTDAITTGLIYKTNEVSLVASDFLVFDDGSQQQSRPAVTATFEEIGTGEQFTVSVNHLKSKSGTGTGADADQGDGQGAFNATRTAAAQQLAEWLSSDNPDGYLTQNGVGDTDVLIIGDLNSYAQEDPIDAIREAGYVDLIDGFIGQQDAFSYIFDGQQGTLDQGLASQSLAGQVSGVAEWHINAQEPDLFSYSTEFKDPAFYNADVYATSDHDPLLIGLNLGGGIFVA
ncbi:ExeM/NucH family extracellular endonuclease [Neorhizobium huautlense]|uniref:ExeM/NucH family extracellular endonuclease n=1 Tax=Neorhizobium huautlense TaxID=67774 RepID=UPI001475744A|nr:ExeM/NucH family extracellular endonuclease [Neorhizobium huautlense]